MPRKFSVTFDYRCPFARNASEALVTGLRDGKEWEVTFRAFSLDQTKVEPEGTPVWDRPPDSRGSGVLALQWGIAVRDHFPESFLDFHLELFAARHDRGERIDQESVLQDVAARVGLVPDVVAGIVATGEPLDTLAAEHEESVKRWQVFGVPTFIEHDEAVFMRLMERGRVDDVERVLDLIPWTRLNEFKRTTIPR